MMLFDEATHTYTWNGKPFTPVGDFISKFYKPFAKGMMAQKVAQRDGLDVDEVIKMWESNGDVSRLYGQSVHKAVEHWIKYNQKSNLKHLSDMVDKFSKKYDRERLRAEIIVFDTDTMIAGTVDQIEFITKKKVRVVDVKTNYDIDKKGYGKLLPPLDYLEDNKINRYRLQTSMYAYMLEKKGYEVEECLLEHWNGSEFSTIHLDRVEVEPLLTYKPISKKIVRI